MRATLEERATLDTAVAGTGEQPQKPFLDVTQDDWNGAVAAIREAFLATQAAARRGDRRIVLGVIGSRGATGSRRRTGRRLAGAFLHTIGQVAAVELGPEGTTVNVIAPGFVGDARFDAGVPLGRAPEPQDVAEACAFLASDAAGYISGAIIPIDGGFTVTKTEGGSPLAS